MRRWLWTILAALVLSTSAALAQSAGESLQAASPVPVSRLTWPGIVIILILALFLTAAIAGPLIRANTNEDLDAPP